MAMAPHLLTYEILNGIAIATRQKRIASGRAAQAVANLMALGVQLKEVEPQRVLELALRHNLAAYDAAYLALAETEGCELWTGDKPFYQAIRSELPWVKWIGSYVSVAVE